MKTTYNRTKIIATMGPASSSKEILIELVKAGLDVCRVNFSHGAYEQHQKLIDTVREINTEYNTHIGILVDLQGPKIRIGEMEPGVILESGQHVTITTKKQIGNKDTIYITYDHFPQDVTFGELILLDDGKLQMRILETNNKDTVKAQVVYGGLLSSNKGVNLPDTKISSSSLTEKDLEDLEFALENDVEWIGLSFVRSAEDIIDLKRRIAEKGKTARVVAKIEKPEALENIDAIILESDALMVARGDLGVEIPMEQVPVMQKMIVKKCIVAAKPIIIATQMMESMITNARPTRAEANDVANSVLDGADAVMLSAETSVGSYPVLVVQAMHKIISSVEATGYNFNKGFTADKTTKTYLSDAICYNACVLAEQTDAVGIVAMSNSGYSAFRISSHRPQALTFIFTTNKALLNTLSLVWGVRGFYYDQFVSTDDTINDVNSILKEQGLVDVNDIVINTSSIPILRKGRTNMIKLSVIH